jgi:hypothetical protein
MSAERITGGCQCGAVRFHATGLGRASICHCRMCQKAFGGLFGPLVTAKGLEWTRGEPKRFASSNVARRGFCAACGTPLFYREFARPEDEFELMTGTLDDPDIAPPDHHVGIESKVAWLMMGDGLPAVETGKWSGSDPSRITSNQDAAGAAREKTR